MKLKKSLSIATVCTALMLSIAACGGAKAPAPSPTNNTAPTPSTPAAGGAENEEAMSIYKGNCMACHANDLSGGGSFPNLQAVGSRLSESDISTVIHKGRNGMPAFEGKLTEDEINTLAKWLAEKK